MTGTVRVPDPVKTKVEAESERRDVSQGAVVETWMDKAEKYDALEART